MRNSVEGFTFQVQVDDAAESAAWYSSLLALPQREPYVSYNGHFKRILAPTEINGQTSLELIDEDADDHLKIGSCSFRVFPEVHPEIRLRQLGWSAEEVVARENGLVMAWLRDIDGNTVLVCHSKKGGADGFCRRLEC